MADIHKLDTRRIYDQFYLIFLYLSSRISYIELVGDKNWLFVSMLRIYEFLSRPNLLINYWKQHH